MSDKIEQEVEDEFADIKAKISELEAKRVELQSRLNSAANLRADLRDAERLLVELNNELFRSQNVKK